jgi:hypothetical protein
MQIRAHWRVLSKVHSDSGIATTMFENCSIGLSICPTIEWNPDSSTPLRFALKAVNPVVTITPPALDIHSSGENESLYRFLQTVCGIEIRRQMQKSLEKHMIHMVDEVGNSCIQQFTKSATGSTMLRELSSLLSQKSAENIMKETLKSDVVAAEKVDVLVEPVEDVSDVDEEDSSTHACGGAGGGDRHAGDGDGEHSGEDGEEEDDEDDIRDESDESDESDDEEEEEEEEEERKMSEPAPGS